MCYLYFMPDAGWMADLSSSIRSLDELPPFLEPTAEERAFEKHAGAGPARAGGRGGGRHPGSNESEAAGRRLPLLVPPVVVARLERAAEAAGGTLPADHPLRLQAIPTEAELLPLPHELADPLGEAGHSPLPRLVYRYADRALLLVTDQCALHCRHCFRSRFTGGGRGAISRDELHEVAEYLARRPEISELILSGGDALLLPDAKLDEILRLTGRVRANLTFRVATRAPIVLPSRITAPLVRMLRSQAPLWVVTQVNHPDELDEASGEALDRLVDGGVPVVNQTVLLSGVNDDAATLATLFRSLVARRVKPYYLFQGDLAPGTSRFRVNLERAIEIAAELRRRLSGLAMPVLAVDIPGGGGKVRLEGSAYDGEDANGYRLIGLDGRVYHYPKEIKV